MSAPGFTPIQLYFSTTAAAAPSAGNLANGELAINITDGRLFYKDNGGVVKVLAGTGGTGVVAGSNTQIQFNNNGVFGAAAGLTWDGTYLTANSIKNSALTSGRVPYVGASGLLLDSANLTFDGNNFGGNVNVLVSDNKAIGFGANAYWLGNSTSGFLAGYINGSEGLRLTSGGLVIGSTTALAKLDVKGGTTIANLGDWNSKSNSIFELANPAVRFGIGYDSSDQVLLQAFDSSNNAKLLCLQGYGGNVGIGSNAVPSVGSTVVLGVGGANGGTLAVLQSGNIVYRTSASTSGVDFFNPNSSPMQWYTAGTSRMVLDANGDFNVGGSITNGIRATFEKNNPTRGILAHIYNIASSGQTGAQLMFTQNNIANFVIGQPAGLNAFVLWGGRNTSSDGTEFCRFDSSANWGLGTSSPSNFGKAAILISGAGGAASTQTNSSLSVGATSTTGVLNFGVDSTAGFYSWIQSRNYSSSTYYDLVLNPSGGNVLIGTTDNGTSGTNYGIALRAPSGGTQLRINTAGTTDTNIAVFRVGGSDVFRVATNGGIANFSANNVNLSDRNEKTNFAPAGEYLSKICAIPVQTYNYINQNLENDPGLTLGVVAQDVQAVAPELVVESNWGTEDNPKMRLSIYQTDLQYALMKCIQEQQALIQTLTARVAALESN